MNPGALILESLFLNWKEVEKQINNASTRNAGLLENSTERRPRDAGHLLGHLPGLCKLEATERGGVPGNPASARIGDQGKETGEHVKQMQPLRG